MVLKASWAVVGASWAVLGASRAVLGAILGPVWGRIWAPDRLVGPEKVPDANKGNRGKDPCGWGICAFWDKDVKILQRAGPGLGRNVCVILDYPSSSSFRISWSCSLHSKIRQPPLGATRL